MIEHCGLFVTSIEKDPALSDGRILVNDELVKVHIITNNTHLVLLVIYTGKRQEPDRTIA